MAANAKKVLEVRTPPPMHWVGDGFPVRTLFSYDEDSALVSPFLLLDYAAPAKIAPTDKRRGVGEHPHRGFETVTIAYQGEIEHRDSGGHGGRIGPGDVQWMTAASGVVHEEMLAADFTKKGGTIQMVQLWVNLPAKLKMSKPRYQDITKGSIPSVTADGTVVRVIAGGFRDARGPAKTFTPINLWDLRLKAGTTFEADLPEGHGAAILVIAGGASINGSKPIDESKLAILDRKGERVSIAAKHDATVLLMSGEPIDEPVAGYGPFVMNSRDEIVKAIEDFQAGKMGRLA